MGKGRVRIGSRAVNQAPNRAAVEIELTKKKDELLKDVK